MELVPENALPNQKDQKQAILDLFNEMKEDTSSLYSNEVITIDAIGTAAKNFLVLLSRTDDNAILRELNEWLENPPIESKASLESLLMTMPIVITGCLCLITVTSGIRYKKGEWVYDAKGSKTIIRDNIRALKDILKLGLSRT